MIKLHIINLKYIPVFDFDNFRDIIIVRAIIQARIATKNTITKKIGLDFSFCVSNLFFNIVFKSELFILKSFLGISSKFFNSLVEIILFLLESETLTLILLSISEPGKLSKF